MHDNLLVRDFIATNIVAVQSSTTQNTKILDDLTFSNKHFFETSRWVTKIQWQSGTLNQLVSEREYHYEINKKPKNY